MVLDGMDGQPVDGRVQQELDDELWQLLALAGDEVVGPASCGGARGSDDILELVGDTV